MGQSRCRATQSGQPGPEFQLRDVRDAAPRLGIELVIFNASTEAEFDGAFTAMVDRKIEALLVGADPFFNIRRARLIALAAQSAAGHL